jgi:integrase
MARPKLDPKFKQARLTAAKRHAAMINKDRHKPPFVYAFATPSGKVLIRFEPPRGKKVILRSPFPSLEFDRELLAIKEGRSTQPIAARSAVEAPRLAEPETWRWLCQEFFLSKAFLKYSQNDQRVRRNVLEKTWDEHLVGDDPTSPKFGDMPVRQFRTKAIITLRDRKARYTTKPDPMYPNDRRKDRSMPTKPEAGNSVVRYIRRVMEWAVEEHTDLVDGRNWGREVKLIASETEGHATWGPVQCAIFEEMYPRGTRARLIYDIAKTTAQRLSDLARLSPNMLGYSPKGFERLRFTQSKNRNRKPVPAYVPMTKELRDALAAAEKAGVLGQETWIAQRNGKPFTTEKSIGNDFTDYCRKAGLVGFSLHGLRKTAVVEMIMADFSFFEIMAITGHRSKREIERYGREYMREIAMEAAFEKWLERHKHEDEFDERIVEAA